IQVYLLWNPLLHLVELTRWAYFPSYQPLWEVNAGYPLAVAFAVMGIGVMMYRQRRLQLQTRAA
ncbi:MAG TPA: hypothetical protein VLA16_03155, partial [Ideonella sp.]|nr:hypothetical protein [Ideonella sp.]